MELTEDEFIQKYAKNCGHCNRNTLLPCEYEFILIKEKKLWTQLSLKLKMYLVMLFQKILFHQNR